MLLEACASAPRALDRPPTTLSEINRALSWRFADVLLARKIEMRGLRSVEVTPERLTWTNEHGQRREMPIGEVTRIVLRGRDPAAAPPTEGARLLADPSAPVEPPLGTLATGSFSGDDAVLVGALYGALYLASKGVEDPGVVIYEAPVARYLAVAPPAELATPPITDPPARPTSG